jgi:hypothetical protein
VERQAGDDDVKALVAEPPLPGVAVAQLDPLGRGLAMVAAGSLPAWSCRCPSSGSLARAGRELVEP